MADLFDIYVAKKLSGGGGGAEPYIVNAVLDSETGTTTCDKTASEIVNAFNSGSLVQIIFEAAFEGWSEDVFRDVVYQIHFGKSAGETQGVFDSFTIEIVTMQYTYQVYSTTSFEDALSKYPSYS